MSVQAPTEVIILQPEPVGGGSDQGRTNRLEAAGDTAKLRSRSVVKGGAGSELDATNKLRMTGAVESDKTAKLARGGVAARHFDIEVGAEQGIGPLVRAAETVLKQGNKHVVVDLSRFSTLKADEIRSLIDVRRGYVKAGGQLVVSGLQRQVEAAIKALELERELELAPSQEQALERIGGGDSRGRAERLGELSIDVHEVDLGGRRPDLGFADDFRRKGPEGLSRELVVLKCDAPGVAKVAQHVRQLSDKQLTAFVVDLSGVDKLEGSAVKEIIKAQKHLEARQGFLAVANPRESVASLLKVMGLDRDLPTYATRAAAVDGFRERLLEDIEARQGGGASKSTVLAAGDSTQAQKVDDTLRLKGLKPASAGGAALEPLPGGGAGELLFGRAGAGADAAREHTVTVPRILASPRGLAGLGAAVGELASARRPFVLVDLSEVERLDAAGLQALAQAHETGSEEGTKVVFAEASPDARALADRLGLGRSLDLHASEEDAARRIAQEIADKADVSAVALRLAEHEVDEERPAHQTASFSVPDFDDDDEAGPGKRLDETDKLKAPSFLREPPPSEARTEERPVHKTASFSVPDFDDDEDEEEPAKPGKTTVFGAPEFDDEDEATGDAEDTDLLDESDRTALLSEPPRFRDEEEDEGAKTDKVDPALLARTEAEEAERRPAHRTASFQVPSFDDDDDDEAPPSAGPGPDDVDEKPSATAVFGAPSFEDDDDAPFDETDKVSLPDFEGDEDRDRPVHKTASFSVPNFDDDDDEAEADEAAAKAPGDEKPSATAVFGAPSFDDDDDDAPFDETDKMRAPPRAADDERPVHKTASFSVPNFDDDEDEEQADAGEAAAPGDEKPSATAVFGAPSFDDDDDDDAPFDETDKMRAAPRAADDERPVHKTASFSVPNFDDDEDEEEAGDERPSTGTTVLSTPDFDSDEDRDAFADTDRLKAPSEAKTEERPVHKTAAFSVPSFDDDDDEGGDGEGAPRPGHTTVLSTPDFDEDEDDRKQAAAAGKKTTLVSAPDLDEGEGEDEQKKPGRTTVLSAPDFDEDDDDRRERAAAGKKTTLVSAADFDDEDDDERRKPGRTTVLSAPDFDEDEQDRRDREAAGKKTTVLAAPDAIDIESTGPLSPLSGAKKGARKAAGDDTAPLSEVDYGETDRLPGVTHADTNRLQLDADDTARLEAEIDAAFEDTKKLKSEGIDTGKLAPPVKPAKGASPPLAPTTKEMAAAPPANRPDLRGAKTEMMPGLSPAEARRLAEEAARGAKAAPAAPAKPAPAKPPAAPAPASKKDFQVAKTEAMDGMSRAEALRQVEAMKGGGPPPAAPRKDLQASQTDRMAGMAKDEAKLRGAKTEAMPGLSRDQAAREVAAQDRKTGEISAPVAPPGGGSKAGLFAGLAAIALLAVGGVWYATRPKAPEPPPVVTPDGGKPSTDKTDPRVAEASKKIGAALLDAFGSE